MFGEGEIMKNNGKTKQKEEGQRGQKGKRERMSRNCRKLMGL